MDSQLDSRNKLLYKDNFNKISKLKVCVIGLGGVGSSIPLNLTRCGVKNFLLIDKDKVELSNLNRQVSFNLDDISLDKVDVVKNKILKIRKDSIVNVIKTRIDSFFNYSLLNNYDYILDCIDDINAKISLIKYCYLNNLNIISSLGMGARTNISKVKIVSLNKTVNDPLAKKLRYLLKKENIELNKIKVVFSEEIPIKINGKIIPSSVFVPNMAGLILASYIINETILKGENINEKN